MPQNHRSTKIIIDGRVLTHDKKTGVEIHAIEIIKNLLLLHDVKVVKPSFKNKIYTHFWEHFILPFLAIRYDLLYAPSNIAPFFLFPRTKLVLTLHDLAFIDFSDKFSFAFQKYYKILVPKCIKKSRYIITISEYSKSRITKEFPSTEKKIVTIYHGLPEVFHNIKPQAKENYILYVGAMNEIKNFHGVLKAFLLLSDVHIKLKMVLPDVNTINRSKEVDSLLNEAINHPRIEILGYTDQKKLIDIYSKAKIFVFPSFHESFGFPVLEAMACGTPVIASNRGALPEICSSAAIYVDPDNIDNITDKIKKLLQDEPLQRKMTNEGLKIAKKFTWEKSAQAYSKIFEKVIQNAG